MNTCIAWVGLAFLVVAETVMYRYYIYAFNIINSYMVITIKYF